jgi:hypothetical protein
MAGLSAAERWRVSCERKIEMQLVHATHYVEIIRRTDQGG